MNIIYTRKTKKPAAEVGERFKKEIQTEGITLVGEKEILKKKGVLLYFLKPAWTEKIVETDSTLIGLVPNVAFIREKDGETLVSISNPQLLGGGPHLDILASVIEEIDATLRKIINETTGVRDPKLEKIVLYSTASCPYCKMEKAYLEERKVPFELVMVDTDRNAAEEMVRKTGQMGVPVTELIFDDGDSEIVMGFDKGRLNTLLMQRSE